MNLTDKKIRLTEFWKKKSKEHSLEDYSFYFSKRYWAMAWCYYHNNKKEIVFSEPWMEVNTISDLKQIMLHEMAHAITKSGHTPQFRNVARQIGCEERHIRIYSKHRWDNRVIPVLSEKYRK